MLNMKKIFKTLPPPPKYLCFVYINEYVRFKDQQKKDAIIYTEKEIEPIQKLMLQMEITDFTFIPVKLGYNDFFYLKKA